MGLFFYNSVVTKSYFVVYKSTNIILKINHDDILVLRNVDLSTYIRTRTFSVFDVFLSWKNC